MFIKILINIVLISVLYGCATQPAQKSIADIKQENSALKLEVPEYVPANIKGLDSFTCDELTELCTMSLSDGRQMEYDRTRMYELYKLDHIKDVELVKAFNRMVDYKSHSEYMVLKLKESNQELEKAYKEERTFNTVKTWMERALWLGSVLLFKSF